MPRRLEFAAVIEASLSGMISGEQFRSFQNDLNFDELMLFSDLLIERAASLGKQPKLMWRRGN